MVPFAGFCIQCLSWDLWSDQNVSFRIRLRARPKPIADSSVNSPTQLRPSLGRSKIARVQTRRQRVKNALLWIDVMSGRIWGIEIPSCGKAVLSSWRSAFKLSQDLVQVARAVKGGSELIIKTRIWRLTSDRDAVMQSIEYGIVCRRRRQLYVVGSRTAGSGVYVRRLSTQDS